jgi:hypothetical protein
MQSSSEVAYNDTRGHGQFKATRPERKEKERSGLTALNYRHSILFNDLYDPFEFQ